MAKRKFVFPFFVSFLLYLSTSDWLTQLMRCVCHSMCFINLFCPFFPCSLFHSLNWRVLAYFLGKEYEWMFCECFFSFSFTFVGIYYLITISFITIKSWVAHQPYPTATPKELMDVKLQTLFEFCMHFIAVILLNHNSFITWLVYRIIIYCEPACTVWFTRIFCQRYYYPYQVILFTCLCLMQIL
jgi:hypothetical protein